MSEATLKSALPRQVSRFAVIGLMATAVHVIIASFAHYSLGFTPLMANFIAFLTAWNVSFAGHYFWTFDQASTVRQAMPRFFLVSIAGLAVNQAIVWLVVVFLGKSFWLAMALVVMIIPAASFLSSKLWAFRAQVGAGARS